MGTTAKNKNRYGALQSANPDAPKTGYRRFLTGDERNAVKNAVKPTVEQASVLPTSTQPPVSPTSTQVENGRSLPEPTQVSQPNVSSGSETAIEKAETEYLSYLTNQKTSAIKAAKKQYDTDVVDAERRYARSRADHGAQAEKLRELGIDSSGYANYLSDRAYAQMVSEIQAAKARQSDNEAAANRAYDDGYSAYLLNKTANEEAEKEEQKFEYESGISNGTLFGTGDAYVTKDKASKTLGDIAAVYGEDSSELAQAKKRYQESYEIRVDKDYFTKGGDGQHVIGITQEELNNAGEGDKMIAWNGTSKIKLVKGGIATGDVVSAFKSSGMHERKNEPIIFAFRGKAYVGYNGTVFAIKEGEKSYDKLMELLNDDSVSGFKN